MMKAEKRKRIFRMPPCPAYDIIGMEHWLEEMAAQGFVLKRFFTNLIAVFEQQEPVQRRYRLASVSSNAFVVPDLDDSLACLKEYCEAYGWNYVSHRGSFCIFMTSDETARELHTDGDIQAMALEQVSKERKASLILPIFWTALILWQLMQGGMMLNAIQLGSARVLLFTVLVLMIVTDAFLELQHLRKVQKAVQDRIEIQKKRNSMVYQARIILLMFTVLSILLVTGIQYYGEKTGNDKIPLASYTGEIPSLTIQDLVPGDTYMETDQSKYANVIIAKSDLLAPVYVSFNQRGAVYQNGICQFEGFIDVTYLETRAPWIATRVAEEFQRRDEKMWRDRFHLYEQLELADLDVDYVAVWEQLLPAFVIAEGNKVVYVYYYQSSGGDELTMDEITQMYAESLK